jgi:hypothetical protein
MLSTVGKGKTVRKVDTVSLEKSSFSGIYRNEQFGFREGHSATHQLLRVVKYIKSGLRTKLSTGLLLFDVEKAFDCVWHGALLHKMLNFNFPMIWTKIIMSFLSGRTFLWRYLELDHWNESLRVLYCHPHCSTYSRLIFQNLMKYTWLCSLMTRPFSHPILRWIGPLQTALNCLRDYYSKWVELI